MDDPYQRTCPNCGLINDREPYDIGSGPELSCIGCEWCWGAMGQDLKPLDVRTMGDVPGLRPREG